MKFGSNRCVAMMIESGIMQQIGDEAFSKIGESLLFQSSSLYVRFFSFRYDLLLKMSRLQSRVRRFCWCPVSVLKVFWRFLDEFRLLQLDWLGGFAACHRIRVFALPALVAAVSLRYGTAVFSLLQQPVPNYQKVVSRYKNENTIPIVFDSAEASLFEARIEDNVRRSTRQRGLPPRLQDSKRVQDNEINEDGDFVHFSLMAASEPVK
ncbi:hypothetical protein KIW84_030412 [Lathyrus oleraceus]|uniref:Uncharacterized protein n=1 Tax=Pisum sativum TaxID=3888 RepID=A0A9D4XN99_PEA|nr:hypothetical protein KIW84_030412 [Pisum sativum]